MIATTTTPTTTTMAHDLAELCAAHLHAEAAIMELARKIFVAMEHCFSRDGLAVLSTVERDRQEVELHLTELRRRRLEFRQTIRVRLPQLGEDFRLDDVIRQCLPAAQMTLLLDLAKVRQLAVKLLSHHHWFAVHLQIHLEAYGRLLRGCIGGPTQSARYGRDGRLPIDEYRPLLEVLG